MPTIELLNRTRRSLSLAFGHAEVCSVLGKCICTVRGKGGAFHVSSGKALKVPEAALKAASVQKAIKAGAIEVRVTTVVTAKKEDSEKGAKAPSRKTR